MVNPQRPGFRTLPATNYRVPWANEFNGQPHPGRPSASTPNRNSRVAGAYHGGGNYDRSEFADGRRHREPYRGDHRHDRDHFFYGAAVLPWWLSSYSYLGYPSFDQYPPWWDYDDSSDAQAAAPQGPMQPDSEQDYSAQQPPPEGPDDSASLPRWPSINPPVEQTEQQSAPLSVTAQPATPVTLVFKDGRPPEKIHNFLVTAGTLYVMDQQRQDIPIAALDLAETARINHQAGVEFNVPGASK